MTVWVLTYSIQYETVNTFVCAWAKMPTLKELSEMIQTTTSEDVDVAHLKKEKHYYTNWGITFELNKYTLGKEFRE